MRVKFSYRKKGDGSICNDVNATDNTEISPIAYAVETSRSGHPSLQSKRLSPAVNGVALRSTDRFTVRPLLSAALITTVGHLSRELSRLLWHFLTHGEEK